MIAPENIFLGRVGQRLFEYLDQAEHDGVEIFVHELGALGAVRRLRAECAIILPAFAALNIEIEVGVEEGMQRALDRRLAARRAVIIVERLHPLVDRHHSAPREYRVEQRPLVVEIIVEQRVVDPDLFRDILQRHAVKAVLRKQEFGGVEDLLHHLGALFRLRRALHRTLCLRRQIPVLPHFIRTCHTAAQRAYTCP